MRLHEGTWRSEGACIIDGGMDPRCSAISPTDRIRGPSSVACEFGIGKPLNY